MVTQIKDFAISRLTIGSTSDFHSKMNAKIKELTPAALHIEALATVYDLRCTELQKIVNRATAYVSTSKMKETDRPRDNYVGVIRNVSLAHVTNPISTKREPALQLKAALAPYAGIGNHEYSKETAEIKGMLEVLREPENAAAITALGLDDEVAGLEEANQAFEEMFLGKAEEKSDRMPQSDTDSRELCRQANDEYAAIVQTINAYAIVQPSDEINEFIHFANGLVGVFADIAESGASGGSGEDDRPVIPDEDEDPEKPDEGEGDGEDDRPVIPDEGEDETGKDENGDDLPPIE